MACGCSILHRRAVTGRTGSIPIEEPGRSVGMRGPLFGAKGEDMRFACMRAAAAFFSVALLAGADHPTVAQSVDPKAADQRSSGGDAGKIGNKAIGEHVVAAQQIPGVPVDKPECQWLGNRVVSRLWREDLGTAFRDLDLYDRFGCSAGHIQMAFRCVVRQGNTDPKAAGSLNERANACWINPDVDPMTVPPASASVATTAQVQ